MPSFGSPGDTGGRNLPPGGRFLIPSHPDGRRKPTGAGEPQAARRLVHPGQPGRHDGRPRRDARLPRRLPATAQPLRLLDPACGDGRFLAAVVERAAQHGVHCAVVGVDVDLQAVAAARAELPGARIECADALRHDFGGERFDLVIGNPPFLSQMAAATTRGGASGRSGGPYADAAVEFLTLAGELVADHGRVAGSVFMMAGPLSG